MGLQLRQRRSRRGRALCVALLGAILACGLSCSAAQHQQLARPAQQQWAALAGRRLLSLLGGSSSGSSAGQAEATSPHPEVLVTGVEAGEGAPSGERTGPREAQDGTWPEDEAAASSGSPPESLLGDLLVAASDSTNDTIASVLDKALAKEFEEETADAEADKGRTYNETVASEEGRVETVVRISGSGKRSDERDSGSGGGEGSSGDASSGDGASGSSANATSSGGGGSTSEGAGTEPPPKAELPSIEKGVDRIIDSNDNEFVLSAPKDQVATLTLDPLLIQDLTFLFASAAVMGAVFEAIGQPVINGYLVAGAVVGPGGLQLIKELVQVESLAQLGVQLLLFNLGRELSLRKLRAVWSVALLGGGLQIAALMFLGGLVAAAVESPVAQGVFVGALLSMSSTSVVVKCLEARRMAGSAFGQIVIGTLILQDCSVGLMFALMPAFGSAARHHSRSVAARAGAGLATGMEGDGGTSLAFANYVRDAALTGVAVLVARVLVKLLLLVAVAYLVARTVLPLLLRTLLQHASKELVQLSLVSLCLSSAWLCGELGLSEELGAFVAGAMMAFAERLLVAQGFLPPPLSAPGTPTHKSSRSGCTSTDGNTPKAGAHAGGSAAAVVYYRIASATAALMRQDSAERESLIAGLPTHTAHGVAAGGGGKEAPLAPVSETRPLPDLTLHAPHPGAGGAAHPVAASVCANIDSIQNVLTALFVASMGLIMSPVFLWHHAAVLLTGTLVVTLLKAAVVTLVVRLFGVPLKLSLAVALAMAHIGEFSFVLLSMANQLKLLSSQVYMLLLGVTAMSLLTTPFVILGTISVLSRDGPAALHMSGPRLRLSADGRSSGGGGAMSAPAGADWGVVREERPEQARCSSRQTREHRASHTGGGGGKQRE